MAEKPLISEETDLLEPTLLDELICHISSLASVYHKPPSAFVEGTRIGETRRVLPRAVSGELDEAAAPAAAATEAAPAAAAPAAAPATVIPGADSLIGDLLSLDIGTPAPPPVAADTVTSGAVLDFLGGGIHSFIF